MSEEDVLDLVLGRGGSTLADYEDGWVDDPEREVEEQGGDWSQVRRALRGLVMNAAEEVTAAGRSVMELVTASAPWTRVDGGDRHSVASALYRSLAATGKGESIFRSGTDALLRQNYPAELVQRIPPWAAQRFVGLGSVWAHQCVSDPRLIVDLGCGAGVDVHVARAVHPGAAVVGIDRSMELLAGASASRAAATGFLRGAIPTLPCRARVFDLVLANGLPPLLGTATMPASLAECGRVLRPGGELRFTCLVVGDDRPAEELSDACIFNALRIGKPIVPAVRTALVAAGFVPRTLAFNPSPFVPGFRAAGVRSATFGAVRGSAG